MDLSCMWLPELEMEDHGLLIFNDNLHKPYNSVDNLSYDSFSPESYTENEYFVDRSFRTPTSAKEKVEIKLPSYQKATKIETLSQIPKPTSLSSSTFTISFGDLKPEVEISQFNDSFGYEAVGTEKVQTLARGTVQAQDHVLAERKRREKLNRYFIDMSALLPNLKKMDKASVLEDAANYIRELQDRVKELEGHLSVKGKDAKESIIAIQRSRLANDDDDLSSNEGFADIGCESSTEIEVRMLGSDVLVRIHSHTNSCVLVKALSKMQKLGLSIISSSVMPSVNTTTLITIVAQIEDDKFTTATDLVRNLQLVV